MEALDGSNNTIFMQKVYISNNKEKNIASGSLICNITSKGVTKKKISLHKTNSPVICSTCF